MQDVPNQSNHLSSVRASLQPSTVGLTQNGQARLTGLELGEQVFIGFPKGVSILLSGGNPKPL